MPPTSGEITIGNTVVNDLEPGERGLGMVFQDLALFPHMTVFENIAFGLRVKKVAEREIRERVTAAAAALHIEPLLGKLPRECSGGESQRVALARTIVTNPSVFLMDEPLSSLDAKLRVDMRTELKALHKRLNATFVYVTHDQAEAMTMADRIVVMSKGRIEQVGTPLEIYNRPATRFVAGFFGTPTMNFLEGTVEVNGSGRRFRSAGHRAAAARHGAGRRRRPQGRARRALGARAGGRRCGVKGTVQLIEPLGDVTLVYFDYGQSSALVAKVGPSTPLKPGTPLSFRFAADYCHLFDGSTRSKAPLNGVARDEFRSVRLHHRGRRQRGLRPGQSAHRVGAISRAAVRGGAQRPASMAPCPDRLRQAFHRPAIQLVLRDRAAARLPRPRGHRPARQGAGRIELDQWADLHSRPGRRFRPWRQLGNAGWSFDDVLPYFRKAEDNERGADALHGAGGPLAVSDMRDLHPLAAAFVEAAQQCGYPRNDDFNGPAQEGAGHYQTTTRNGLRCSTAAGYLKPARRRTNLEVVSRGARHAHSV